MGDVFVKADQQSEKALTLLNKAEALFPNTYVPTELWLNGLTTYRGVVVPIEQVSYKFLMDYYQRAFLQAYIKLFSNLWKDKSALTSEFSFRLILEMGVENSFLVYGKSIEEKDRKLYFTVQLLADYVSIETGMSSFFYNWFTKLYDENKLLLEDLLNIKDREILSDLRANIGHYENVNSYRKDVEEARKLVQRVKGRLLDKYTQKGMYISNDNVKGMKSGEAHTLHGNIFLLSNRLSEKSKTNHLFRLYSYLLLPTTFLLRRLGDYPGNTEFLAEVNKFLVEYNIFGSELSTAWKSAGEQ